jgi:hypothetical protein
MSFWYGSKLHFICFPHLNRPSLDDCPRDVVGDIPSCCITGRHNCISVNGKTVQTMRHPVSAYSETKEIHWDMSLIPVESIIRRVALGVWGVVTTSPPRPTTSVALSPTPLFLWHLFGTGAHARWPCWCNDGADRAAGPVGPWCMNKKSSPKACLPAGSLCVCVCSSNAVGLR